MPSNSHFANCLTADKTDKEQKSESSEVLINDILCSSTSRYLITEFNGEGRFGKVAKGMNINKLQDVALKILKAEKTARREIKMLEVVSILDPVKKNVVQFFEKFKHKEHTCLVFELLDKSLFQLFKERHWRPLSPSAIRPITHQLLTALDALKGIGVIHSDLKPDNIMLANHLTEPFRVKLIDFGLSFTTLNKKCGMRLQPLGYRAPEVTLGLPISEAIDMWGLGCVLGFLYLAIHPFAIHCEYQSMRGIVDTLGQPADHLLCAGNYTHKFFKDNLDQALSPDGKAEGSAVPRSNDGVKNMPHSSDGAEAAAEIDATGSAVEDSAVSQGAASPAEGTSANGGSPDEGPPGAR
ncbi:homeodomain-interacting protein kinase 1-like [Seriola lalandi dorsalis]|uniref:homeodomain-interacting protein kinase 1-like n=1 Tax=Seriola lalandi dorsalis TaxID=1841481 RepID=UPI000C6F9AE8|nr:homeodomain-interacting protein kinase 1-like [Seriola lalandi dorsalis]